jgi:hypothetical protein
MGTWDEGSFGNDTACDWVWGLEGKDDLAYVEEAFDRVLSVGESEVTADAAAEAIVAAEVIARLLGNVGEESSYTEACDEWVRAHASLKPTHAMIDKAQRTLERVIRPKSELLELWEEQGADGWLEAVAELLGRLERKK